jgi:hypothetical protein
MYSTRFFASGRVSRLHSLLTISGTLQTAAFSFRRLAIFVRCIALAYLAASCVPVVYSQNADFPPLMLTLSRSRVVGGTTVSLTALTNGVASDVLVESSSPAVAAPAGTDNGIFQIHSNGLNILITTGRVEQETQVTITGILVDHFIHNIHGSPVSVNLTVLPRPRIDSVELTQGIQQLQPLGDLQFDLQSKGEPPVPVIAGKPAVLRVYMAKLDGVSNAHVEISDVLSQGTDITLQPQCTPDMQRRLVNGCQSADFYFVPPAGAFGVTLTIIDDNRNILETERFPFQSRKADTLILKAVSVCDAKDGQGVWQCAPASALSDNIAKLRQLAPTDKIEVRVTGHQVHREFSTFRSDLAWWLAAVKDVNSLFGFLDITDFVPTFHSTYTGTVRPDVLGAIGGISYSIPSRAAMSRTSVSRLGTEAASDVLAHEIGHTLGGQHTNTINPRATAAPPGCYSLARDDNTDWPFPGDNRIQSTVRLEVGFDLVTRQPIIPETTYEIMSYCIPRWISPFSYSKFATALGTTPVPAPPPPPVPGPFSTLSGIINGNSIEFDPVFQIQTNAPVGMGSGTHRIEVRDISGAVLFVRLFTPATSHTETASGDVDGPPSFSELIPVMPGAAQIVILDPTSVQIGVLNLGGASPVVQIVAPTSATVLSGLQTISWTATNPNNRTLTARVLYSANNGATWSQLDQVVGANSTLVNFDALPGGNASALVRVLVSDGINTGDATSAAFSVSRKANLTARILTPAMNSVSRLNDLVTFTADVYDVDDGILDGPAIRWNSSLDGFLGNGASLPITRLQSGTHEITMTATDSDNNAVTKKLTIRVAGAPPVMDLKVQSLDKAPTTCVQVTINPTSGSGGLELASADYSLDGGSSFTNVPLPSLPFTFIVPGSGSFHLLARAFDVAGQLAISDARFATTSTCQRDTTPPVTTATLTPAANSNGWNNTNVTVALFSTDNEAAGSGVKQIQFSLTGAQTGTGIVPGNIASLSILPEGTTIVTYDAADNAGNQELPKLVPVKIDKTPPTIVGSQSPLPNANVWNNTTVSIAFSCADSLSGLAPGSPPANTALTLEGANQQVAGTCQDLAGNASFATVKGVNIDKTPPIVTAAINPQPNGAGWNNSDVTISFGATDSLSGVASVSGPVGIRSEGAGQLVTGNAVDLAGNLSSISLSVNLDKTPPEAFNQFDPLSRDVILLGRDALSGISPGPIKPVSVVALQRTDKDGEDRDAEHSADELRTYEVRDVAGNLLILKEKVKRSDHSIAVQMLSLQYNGEPAITLPDNTQRFEWSFDRDGTLTKLEQQFAILIKTRGREEDGQQLTARFSAREKETLIRRESDPDVSLTRPGLVLLRMATVQGKLVMEF